MYIYLYEPSNLNQNDKINNFSIIFTTRIFNKEQCDVVRTAIKYKKGRTLIICFNLLYYIESGIVSTGIVMRW